MLQLRQDVFCDCGLDILEYTVKEIRDNSEGMFYVLKAKKPVGSRGCIEILIYENSSGEYKYLELVENEDWTEEYGLEPFTNGKYFATREAAKTSFAKTQIQLIEERERKLLSELAELKTRKDRWEKML
jgi:hypothetical protein